MFRPFMSELQQRLTNLLAPTGYLYLCYEVNQTAGFIHIHLLTEGQIARWGTANQTAPDLSATVRTGQAVVYPADAALAVHAQLLAKLLAE